MVVLWQSPGIEEKESEAETDANSGAAAEGEKPSENDEGQSSASVAASTIRVLEPAQLEEGSETAAVAAALRGELAAREGEDVQVLAPALRKRLTTDFGTIWHVVAGSDFVVETAENCRNYVLATTGKTRVVCFQHEQFKGGTTINWDRVINSAPYLLLTILLLGFMTMNAVCKDEAPDPHSPFQAMLHRKLCGPEAEQKLTYVGGGILVLFFMGRRTSRSSRVARGRDAAGKVKAA